MSREAIAEFQVVTNMYDITQGRSTGIQVQAISRSGTNDIHGSTFGFFRSDKFNAADPVKGTVLPYRGPAGGLHARRADREGQAALLRVVRVRAEPADRRADADGAAVAVVGASVEHGAEELSGPRRLSALVHEHLLAPVPALAERQPVPDLERQHASVDGVERDCTPRTTLYGTWTHIVNNELMMQVHGGRQQVLPGSTTRFRRTRGSSTARRSACRCSSSRRSAWAASRTIRTTHGRTTSRARLDVNWHKGKHEMKFGGEVQKDRDTKVWDLNRRGTYVFRTLPSTAILNAAFPQDSWNNPSAWKIRRAAAVPAGVRHLLQQGLPRRRAAPELLGVVRRQLARDART